MFGAKESSSNSSDDDNEENEKNEGNEENEENEAEIEAFFDNEEEAEGPDPVAVPIKTSPDEEYELKVARATATPRKWKSPEK